MVGSFSAKGILVAGIALIILGLERFLNAFLIGGQATSWFTRLVIGLLCTAAGLLLMLSWYVNRYPRR